MIEQIQAIRFDSGKTSTEQFVTEEPQSTPEQQVINTPEPPKTVTEEKNIETKSKEQFANQNLISQTTLSDLEAFIENPKQAENPLLIAEVLFSDGFEKQAAVFYNEAIDRLKREGTLSIHDKAWLLLQTATCFKTYDNKQASKLFKEVIAECPSSTWAPIAKTQSDLVDWLQTEKPQELIKQCKSELTMAVNERRSQ